MSGNVTLHVGRKRAQVTSTPERPTKAIKLETPEKPSGKHTPESIALTDEQPYYEQTVSFSRDSTNLSPAKRTILKHIKVCSVLFFDTIVLMSSIPLAFFTCRIHTLFPRTLQLISYDMAHWLGKQWRSVYW